MRDQLHDRQLPSTGGYADFPCVFQRYSATLGWHTRGSIRDGAGDGERGRASSSSELSETREGVDAEEDEERLLCSRGLESIRRVVVSTHNTAAIQRSFSSRSPLEAAHTVRLPMTRLVGIFVGQLYLGVAALAFDQLRIYDSHEWIVCELLFASHFRIASVSGITVGECF